MRPFGVIPSVLPESPTFRESVAWMRELVRFVGPGFHPDTAFEDYVRPDGTGSFDAPTCTRLSGEMGRAWDCLSQHGVDVYRVALPVQRKLLHMETMR